jgi:hypothetical protein
MENRESKVQVDLGYVGELVKEDTNPYDSKWGGVPVCLLLHLSIVVHH